VKFYDNNNIKTKVHEATKKKKKGSSVGFV